MYFLSSVTTFAELAHKRRCHCELHTNESEMDLNYQQLPFRLSHLSVLVEQNLLLKSFVRSFFYTTAIRNVFASHKLSNIHFSSLRPTLAVKKRKLDTRKTVSLYLNTTIGQLKNLLKLEHHAGVKNGQITYENSPASQVD